MAVARAVDRSIARGLILEKSPGELTAPPGVLGNMETTYCIEAIIALPLAAFDTFALLALEAAKADGPQLCPTLEPI